MKTEQLKKEIIEMLDVFMANSFLIPSKWSYSRNFSNIDGSFMTFANNDRNHLSIDLILNGKPINKTFHKFASAQKWEIKGDNLLTCKPVKTQLEETHKILKAIYNEIYSLDPTKITAKTKETYAKITQAKSEISELRKKIATYEKELEDAASDNKIYSN